MPVKSKVWRPSYISFSQLKLWETDPDEYYRRYVLGEKWEGNKYTEFGSKLAQALESNKPCDDMGLEHIRLFIPNFVAREFKIEAEILGVPILAKLDGFDPKKFEIDEVKTGKAWSQRRVDEDDQLTFYSLACFQKYRKQPSIIRLHWAKTIEDEEGNVKATGELKTFITGRAIPQQLELANRIKAAWKEITKLK